MVSPHDVLTAQEIKINFYLCGGVRGYLCGRMWEEKKDIYSRQ